MDRLRNVPTYVLIITLWLMSVRHCIVLKDHGEMWKKAPGVPCILCMGYTLSLRHMLML